MLSVIHAKSFSPFQMERNLLIEYKPAWGKKMSSLLEVSGPHLIKQIPHSTWRNALESCAVPQSVGGVLLKVFYLLHSPQVATIDYLASTISPVQLNSALVCCKWGTSSGAFYFPHWPQWRMSGDWKCSVWSWQHLTQAKSNSKTDWEGSNSNFKLPTLSIHWRTSNVELHSPAHFRGEADLIRLCTPHYAVFWTLLLTLCFLNAHNVRAVTLRKQPHTWLWTPECELLDIGHMPAQFNLWPKLTGIHLKLIEPFPSLPIFCPGSRFR